MIFPQLLLDLHEEIIVDLFAGGGGASCGIEMATGRQVDVAVNHDEDAVALHRENHPQTEHYEADVFEVSPFEATGGRDVGLLWSSPDCTFFSKARGGKPIREVKRRALAWVVKRWAAQVQPRVIMLENVEEFVDWGPLIARRDKKTGRVYKRAEYVDDNGRLKTRREVAEPGERVPTRNQYLVPDKSRAGETFGKWVKELEELGYEVDWKELRACDYGAPTIRKRLFIVARRDGEPIAWPEPTHGEPGSLAVKSGELEPYRTAADCIDWSLPTPSIFLTREEAKAWAKEHGKYPPKRPLAENTMKRIARGVMKYVVENPNPYVVKLSTGEDAASFISTYYGAKSESDVRGNGMESPIGTQTTENRHALLAAHLEPLYSSKNGEVRGASVEKPLHTVTASPRHSVITAFLAQNNAGFYSGAGRSLRGPNGTVLSSGSHQSLVTAHLMTNTNGHSGSESDEPTPTITTGGNQALVTCHVQRDFGNSVGHEATDPLGTITSSGGGKAALVTAFLLKYYGTAVGQDIEGPLHSVTTNDRFGLVVVTIDGQEFVIVDIGLRMLQPRELYRAQGFPDSYVIDRTNGDRLTKTAQVRMCGNAVPPQFVKALVQANICELAARNVAA